MNIMTDHELIQRYLRGKLAVKQRDFTYNTTQAENHPNAQTRKMHQQAAARNQKSIALLVEKLLCEHQIQVKNTGDGRGGRIWTLRCHVCRTSATRL